MNFVGESNQNLHYNHIFLVQPYTKDKVYIDNIQNTACHYMFETIETRTAG